MNHGSLFSGIGGFDLAAQRMGWSNIFQVEIDSFCQRVLQKNFPNAERYSDIRDFDGSKYAGQLDIISGGFPCQPFSVAGKRKGANDDRALWPEMLRVIRTIRPAWVVGENVANIGNMGIEKMLNDLEGAGYSVEVYSIPAIAVGCSHQRERLWIIANNNAFRLPQVQQIRISKVFEFEKNERLSIEELFSLERGKGWVYKPRICGVNDGVPTELDKNRLKQLGNAIVPQVAYQIFQAINNL